MRLLMLGLSIFIVGCGAHATKAPAPGPAVIIEKPVKVYVPIDPKLRTRCQWERDVLPSQSIAATKRRGECLEHYERNLDGIDRVQGKPVPR